MKDFRFLCLYMAMAGCPFVAGAQEGSLRVGADDVALENLKVERSEGKLIVDMDVNLDALKMPSNVRFVFTPLVKAGGKVRTMEPLVINGRRQQIAFERYAHKGFSHQATVVRRRNGKEQTVHYTGVLPYEEWMRNSNIVLAEDLCGCGGDVEEQASTPLHKIRHYAMAYVRPKAEARKVRQEEGRAFLDFPVDKTTLYPDYRDNPRELDKILRTIRVVQEDRNTTITRVSIHGYASPEDTYAHNTELAWGRARMLKDYVARLSGLDEKIFEVEATPEDWEGLRRRVAESGLAHKAGILELIDGDLEPDAKEWAIKSRYPEDYRFMLQNWYPALRHSDYVVTYDVRPFSVDEAKALLYTKPQQLSLEEMFLVAQTYEPGSTEFNEVFEIAVRMFPDNPVANLNVACALIESGQYDRAEPYLKKAGDVPEALHARGVVAARRGKETEAKGLFSRAGAAGVKAATDNLDLMDME